MKPVRPFFTHRKVQVDFTGSLNCANHLYEDKWDSAPGQALIAKCMIFYTRRKSDDLFPLKKFFKKTKKRLDKNTS
jgi:transposase